jgi:hypothetical protein
MADKRINALANTAPSTASDDFIAIDGTTNGTRKLNAFSPTFGGNATVTGTLTTNGGVIIPAAGSISTLTSTNATHVANATWGALSQGYGTTADWSVFNKSQGTVMYVPTGTSNLFLYGKLDANTLSVYSTTASTTTSTGALVVGNGTSGGLGVGGAANIGGALSMYGEDFTIHNVGYGSWVLRNTAGSAVFDIRNGAGSWLTFPNLAGTVEFKTLATTVKVAATTASTSTSSGALVVSGGVGVAGKVNAGSFTTTGHTTSAVENVNVSTTAVDIAIATSVGAIYFVSGYNNSGGAQGTWLLMVRGSNVTTVSSDNNTGLTVTFSVSSGKLQAATASGTLVTNAYAITR